MADEALARALADCLEAMREDDDILNATIAKYPEHRLELEELLRIADLIPVLPTQFSPDPRFLGRTRAWLATLPRHTLNAGSDPALP